MKKILAMILAMLLVMSMTAAFAATLPVENGVATFTKKYETSLSAKANAVNPDAQITFAITASDFENEGTPDPDPIPEISIAPVDTNAFADCDIDITLPTYTVPGIYTYTINEVDSGSAGVTFDTDSYNVKVTVAQGTTAGQVSVESVSLNTVAAEGETSEKVTEITNKYEAGTLFVSKTVTGNLGDKSKEFTFTVTLKSAKPVNADVTIKTEDATKPVSIKVGNDVIAKIDKGWTGEKVVTVVMKHGQNLLFENLPAGVTYTVAEAEAAGYDKTVEGSESGTIAHDDVEVKYTNDKSQDPDTGITLETLPYVFAMSVVLAGAILMVIRRRRNNED